MLKKLHLNKAIDPTQTNAAYIYIYTEIIISILDYYILTDSKGRKKIDSQKIKETMLGNML